MKENTGAQQRNGDEKNIELQRMVMKSQLSSLLFLWISVPYLYIVTGSEHFTEFLTWFSETTNGMSAHVRVDQEWDSI